MFNCYVFSKSLLLKKCCPFHWEHNLPKSKNHGFLCKIYCVCHTTYILRQKKKKKTQKECLFDHFNKHNTTVHFSRLILFSNVTSVISEIRELESKIGKKGGVIKVFFSLLQLWLRRHLLQPNQLASSVHAFGSNKAKRRWPVWHRVGNDNKKHAMATKDNEGNSVYPVRRSRTGNKTTKISSLLEGRYH